MGTEIVTPEKQHRLMFENEQNLFWFTSLRAIEHFFIRKLFKNRRPESVRICDAGCGAGYLVRMLLDKGYDACGFDYSDAAVSFCVQRGLPLDVRIFKADLFDPADPPGMFDCIVSNDVFFAYTPEESRGLCRSMTARLKPGGYLIGQTAAYQFLYSQTDISAGTKHRYNRRELREIFTANGLDIVRLSYRNFMFFLPFMLKRLIFDKKQVAREKAASDLKPIHPVVNNVLKGIFNLDNLLLHYINYPFGGSVFFVCRKGSAV